MPLSKAHITRIRALQDAKSRRQFQEFFAEGVKLVDELLNSKLTITAIYAIDSWTHSSKISNPELVQRVSVNELKRISALSSPNTVLATARTSYAEISEYNFKNELTLVLDGISDPGNMGTILRTAEWFGISQIICSPGSVDCYSPKVVQASMGSVFRIKIAYTPLLPFLNSVVNEIPVYGTFMDATNIVSHPMSDNGLIIIGSESHGISTELLPAITHRISVPRPYGTMPLTESLNAAVATSLVCFEFLRKNGRFEKQADH